MSTKEALVAKEQELEDSRYYLLRISQIEEWLGSKKGD